MLSLGHSVGGDWPQFLGLGGSSVSFETGLPSEWDATKNVVWKTPLPGPGTSSPIVVGNKIFLTGYGGYGIDQDEPGDQKNLKLHLLCIDRKTGQVVWDRWQKPNIPVTDYGGFLALHGYASSTPVADKKTVYAFFGKSGVFAFTFSGRMLWRASVGLKTHAWGSATSLLLHKNLLIVNASVESDALVALDRSTGKEVWRVDGIRDSWSTPAIVDLKNGRQELVVSLHDKVFGIEPNSGKRLWECEGVQDYVCPSVVAHDEVVFISGGRGAAVMMAIQAGGRGDVTKTHKLWELKKTPKVPTQLVHDGLLYWVNCRGIVMCVDAKTGEVFYEERLPKAGKVYASPVLADGMIYIVTRTKGIFVLASGPKFEQLARNELGDESVFNATPAVSDGKLLIRSDKYLYCIGK